LGIILSYIRWSPALIAQPAAPVSYRPLNSLSLAAVLGAHATALFAALYWVHSAPPAEEPKVLTVSMLTQQAEPVKPPEPLPPSPPPPKPVEKPKPKPLLTSPKPTPVADPIIAAPEPPRFDMAYLQNPAPAYPAMSKRLHEEGTAVLRVLVSESGEALSVEVDKSSGYSRLDDAARRAVQRWKFSPSRLGDKPVRGIAMVPIVFSLSRS
jgi:periplasmic protein TonB